MIKSVTRRLLASFGNAEAARGLPRQVEEEIEREQERGEWLIGCVQAAAVVTWAVLYALSRKTAPIDAPFQPVPWTLAFYGAFIGVRMYILAQHKLSDWFVTLSVVVDVAVLMTLIWSFHLQYGQPASFYLKAPTLLYVFVFIAIRTLRFDPRWIILAGVSSAAGWLALLAYAWTDHREDGMVTHDFVAYMTSSKILVGAEFDKVISILMVTAVLALGLQRNRNLLTRAVRDQMAATELSRFVGDGVYDKIASADAPLSPGHGEIRCAAVIFVDLRESTSLTHLMPPASLLALLAEYQELVVPIIRHHGGEIDKFLGDGVMASFGAVRPSETHAADGLRAMEELVVELHRWRQRRLGEGLVAPDFGLGAAAGESLFGVLGSGNRLEYTLIGESVNLAAKLEKETKRRPTRAMTDRHTLDTAIKQGFVAKAAWATLVNQEVAGVSQSLDLCLIED